MIITAQQDFNANDKSFSLCLGGLPPPLTRGASILHKLKLFVGRSGSDGIETMPTILSTTIVSP